MVPCHVWLNQWSPIFCGRSPRNSFAKPLTGWPSFQARTWFPPKTNTVPSAPTCSPVTSPSGFARSVREPVAGSNQNNSPAYLSNSTTRPPHALDDITSAVTSRFCGFVPGAASNASVSIVRPSLSSSRFPTRVS